MKRLIDILLFAAACYAAFALAQYSRLCWEHDAALRILSRDVATLHTIMKREGYIVEAGQ